MKTIIEIAQKHGLNVKVNRYYSINKPNCWLVGTYTGSKATHCNGEERIVLGFNVIEGELYNSKTEKIESVSGELYINTTSALRSYFLPTEENPKDGMVGNKFIVSYKGEQKVKGKKHPVITYTIVSEVREATDK